MKIKKFIKENKKAITIGVVIGITGGLFVVNVKSIANILTVTGDLLEIATNDQKILKCLTEIIISGEKPTTEQIEAAKIVAESATDALKVLSVPRPA